MSAQDPSEAIANVQATMRANTPTVWEGVEIGLAYYAGKYIGIAVNEHVHEHGVFGSAAILVRKLAVALFISAILWLILVGISQLPFFTKMVHG
jgi:hypothetical protein